MDISCNQSTLEMLPDEVLLEVCKYLLCSDILHSFIGLNYRMTQMITSYRQYVSLYKTSLSKFHYLRTNVFPQIGSQIRSLFIDCCHSVLQGDLFLEHFHKKMPMIFPQLERISLMAYRHEQLLAFLSTLNGMDHLVEICLYSLFPIQRLHHPTVVRSLLQVNNNRLTTIFIDDQSSYLSFDDSDYYLNIIQLSIKLETANDLSSLFAAVPNVQYLDVMISENDPQNHNLDEIELSSLSHLTNFRLKSIIRMWKLEELFLLLVHLPLVQHLSLFISTKDKRFTDGNIILSLIPSTVQQFNYAIYFFPDTTFDEYDTIPTSWAPSHPVACVFNDGFLLIHTLPWHFPRISFFSIIDKMVTSQVNCEIGYDRQVEQLDLSIQENSTFSKSLAMISQCRRVKELNIYAINNDAAVKEEQSSIPRFSKLSQLKHVCIYGPLVSDFNHFSFILNAATNLFRLILPFNYLSKLLEDQHISNLLEQRITTLCIYPNDPNSSSVTLNEEHIPIIASVFSRLCDLYVNLSHLPSTATTVSNENTFDDTLAQTVSVQSSQHKNELISLDSSESMLIRVLKEFKEHRLFALCIDGQFLEEIKTNAEQWLRNNTILCEQLFNAAFNNELNRLLIWM